MELRNTLIRIVNLVFPISFLFVVSYFLIAIRSIDYVSYAYAYSDLAPIFIGIYGVFLAFLSIGLAVTPKGTPILSRLVSWVVSILQVWAMIITAEAFVKLKAALSSLVVDHFEITTHTGSISTAFLVAVISFLFAVSMFAAGGIEELIQIFSSSHKESRSNQTSQKSQDSA